MSLTLVRAAYSQHWMLAVSPLSRKAWSMLAFGLLLLLFIGLLYRAAAPQVLARLQGVGGTVSTGKCASPVMSADGRYVAFISTVPNPAAFTQNGKAQVFLCDRTSGDTRCVSVATRGAWGDDDSSAPCLSADGRYVAFVSRAKNLTAAESKGTSNVYLHDNTTGDTRCISVTAAGVPGNGECRQPVLSADGAYLAYVSTAANLHPGDATTGARVYLCNLKEATSTFITAGDQPAISADGRYLALVLSPTSLAQQVVALYDRRTNSITPVAPGARPAISRDGHCVALQSLPNEQGLTTLSLYHPATKKIDLLSLAGEGNTIDGASWAPAFSGNGRFLLFQSAARNVAVSDPAAVELPAGATALYLRDLVSNGTQRLAIITGESSAPQPAAPSANAHYIAIANATTANRLAGTELALYVNSNPAALKSSGYLMRDGETFFPLKAVADWLCAGIQVDESGATTLETGTVTLSFAPYEATAHANDRAFTLKQAPFGRKGTLFIPAQLLKEGLGGEVSWAMKSEQLTLTAREWEHPLVLAKDTTPVPVIAKGEPKQYPGLELYEPKRGCYLGAFLDFDATIKKIFVDEDGRKHHLPEEFEEAVGKEHAIYFFYIGYGYSMPVSWIRELKNRNKFVHIALEPNFGLDAVKDDAYLRSLADILAKSEAKIFLRFASEMNGSWTNYHNNPKQYREKFRLVTSVMRKRAPNVAMVWCPFGGTLEWCKKSNIDAYYPGDDVVDWVGVNIYNVTHHNNSLNEPAINERPEDLMKYVYDGYAKRKPIMICEYGVTHRSKTLDRPCIDFALWKMTSIYESLPKRFPRVKAICYFDGNNWDFCDRPFNDYSVTNDPQVLDCYRKMIAPDYYLSKPE